MGKHRWRIRWLRRPRVTESRIKEPATEARVAPSPHRSTLDHTDRMVLGATPSQDLDTEDLEVDTEVVSEHLEGDTEVVLEDSEVDMVDLEVLVEVSAGEDMEEDLEEDMEEDLEEDFSQDSSGGDKHEDQ